MKPIQNFGLLSAIPAIFLVVSAAFSQEAIKFQIPTDDSGAPAPAVVAPKPDTVQKLGLATGTALNLDVLSAKDTAGFETYSQRIALISDSISAHYGKIEAVKKNTESSMPKLEPKGEFEKQAEFEARKQNWYIELSQRVERETRSYSSRIELLEKAKNRVLNYQAALYSSLDVKTIPTAVSIFIDKEEVGTSPTLHKTLIPGTRVVSLRKEGYSQCDTILQVTPGTKLKLEVELEEKSIFSQEKEISFIKILNKDTTLQGFEARVKIIEARIAQIDEEINEILKNFQNTYPPLEAQRPDETPEAFKSRQDAWTKEGLRQYEELKAKHASYKGKLERSIAVLTDYIVELWSSILSTPAPGAKIELGAYDAETEAFVLAAQDTANEKSPFIFSGMVVVPRDVAITLNRSAPGFVVGLQFINYPFVTDSVNVNLAMKQLVLSNNGQSLKVEGAFGEIERYKPMDGYYAWKYYADSLLKGTLKPQGLDYQYAMGKEATKKVFAEEDESSGLGWRVWTRIISFSAAAIFGGVAVYKHIEASDYWDKANELKKNKEDTEEWKKEYNSNKNSYEDSGSQRTVFGVLSGLCAVGGILTFVF